MLPRQDVGRLAQLRSDDANMPLQTPPVRYLRGRGQFTTVGPAVNIVVNERLHRRVGGSCAQIQAFLTAAQIGVDVDECRGVER